MNLLNLVLINYLHKKGINSNSKVSGTDVAKLLYNFSSEQLRLQKESNLLKTEFTEIFNAGRSFKDMPEGFNEFMMNHWKFKDADEAYDSLNNSDIKIQTCKTFVPDWKTTTVIKCKLCGNDQNQH